MTTVNSKTQIKFTVRKMNGGYVSQVHHDYD